MKLESPTSGYDAPSITIHAVHKKYRSDADGLRAMPICLIVAFKAKGSEHFDFKPPEERVVERNPVRISASGRNAHKKMATLLSRPPSEETGTI